MTRCDEVTQQVFESFCCCSSHQSKKKAWRWIDEWYQPSANTLPKAFQNYSNLCNNTKHVLPSSLHKISHNTGFLYSVFSRVLTICQWSVENISENKKYNSL